jgi:hypothetical protein
MISKRTAKSVELLALDLANEEKKVWRGTERKIKDQHLYKALLPKNSGVSGRKRVGHSVSCQGVLN